MPYALCPMPYAHEYLIFLRKAIYARRKISWHSIDSLNKRLLVIGHWSLVIGYYKLNTYNQFLPNPGMIPNPGLPPPLFLVGAPSRLCLCRPGSKHRV